MIEFPPGRDVWFFAYGSLMWQPGFAHREMIAARLYGYHRAFCVSSKSYRGSPTRPGLVLGLDRGGSCVGRAIGIDAARAAEAAAYLTAREMDGGIYLCRRVAVVIGGRRVSAHALVVNRSDPLYAGKLTSEAIAARIRDCRGERGANRDYLAHTVAHLDALGIGDGRLHRILRMVE